MRLTIALFVVYLAMGCAGALSGGSFNPFEKPSEAPSTPIPLESVLTRSSEFETDAEIRRGCVVAFYHEGVVLLKCLAPGIEPMYQTRFCVVHSDEVLRSASTRVGVLWSCRVEKKTQD